MVNHQDRLDRVFGALVSPARRAILARLEETDGASVSELAEPVAMYLAPEPMAEAMAWLRRYERFWSVSLDRLVVHAEKKEAQARKAGS
jgi:DNA-binding transcriptional ArsR family regulator